MQFDSQRDDQNFIEKISLLVSTAIMIHKILCVQSGGLCVQSGGSLSLKFKVFDIPYQYVTKQ